MKSTMTLLDDNARRAIVKGVSAIYEPVRRTLGPAGYNALIYRTYNRGPRITNDGVTVAEVIEPKDPFVKLAAGAFKEMCKRTNEKAGDGTTTTAVIGGKLLLDVFGKLGEQTSEFTAGARTNVMHIRKEILETAALVKDKIKAMATKIETLEDLEKIAIVSVEDAELGKTVAKLAHDVGLDGYIDVVEGYKGEVEVEVTKGMRFPAKVAAKAFVNNPARYEMIAKDCHVLITNYNLDNAAQVAPALQKLNGATSKLIVLAPSFSENVLINAVNATKGGYHIYPVSVPSLRTEQLEDLAVFCGATVIDKNTGRKLENVQPRDMGFLEKLVVKDTEAREDAVATGGKGEADVAGSSAIRDRISTLEKQKEETKDNRFKIQIERRIASMASAVGVIRVGAPSQAESLYKKLKVEDAVYACKAALRGGYVQGGGLCLKEIAMDLPEDNIVRAALLAPNAQILENAGGELGIGKEVIDPAEAVYYAVDHATSVVAHLATVKIIIPEEPDMQPGDGELYMGRMIGEVAIALKRHLGLLKESEEYAERERNLEFDAVMASDRG